MISDSLKSLISTKFDSYRGMTVETIKRSLGIRSTCKNVNSMIVSKIIDLPSLDSEIVHAMKKTCAFKTVKVLANRTVKESMSFPAIDYFDMKRNDWKNSAVFEYFSSKTIILFVFLEVPDGVIFRGYMFLSLNSSELSAVFEVWEKVKHMLNNDAFIIGGANGFSVENFPKKKDNDVTHLRPHDVNSSVGSVLLPNGRRIMNYCFWLNNSFIEKRLKEAGVI